MSTSAGSRLTPLLLTTCLSLLITCASPAHLSAQAPFDFVASSIQDLKSPNANKREQAAYLLNNRASPNSPAEDREKAVQAVPALLATLKDPDRSVRAASASALGNIPGDPTVIVPALIAALQDPEQTVREQAVSSIGRIHSEPGIAVPALVSLLKASKEGNDETTALIAFGPAAQPALPTLIELLGGAGSSPYQAAKIIAAIGPAAAAAEPALLSIVKKASDSEDLNETGLEAAYALGSIGKDQDQAAALAASMLHSEDRARAAGVLGELGVASESKLPLLVKALNDRDRDVRWISAVAMGRIAKALRDAHRVEAIDALQRVSAAMEKSPDTRVQEQIRICDNAVEALLDYRDHNTK